MVAFEFDVAKAKRLGVNEAIVLAYFQKLSQYSFVTTGSKEVVCTETLLLTLFPWMNAPHVKQVYEKLVETKHFEVSSKDSTLIIPLGVDEKVKVAKSKVEIPVDAKEITYTRRTPTGIEEITQTLHEVTNLFIEQFHVLGINPNADHLYKSKAERRAAAELFEKYGVQSVFEILTIVPRTNTQPYAPQILSPRDLLYKYPKLVLHLKRGEGGEVML